jgi:hypothetical protein
VPRDCCPGGRPAWIRLRPRGSNPTPAPNVADASLDTAPGEPTLVGGFSIGATPEPDPLRRPTTSVVGGLRLPRSGALQEQER